MLYIIVPCAIILAIGWYLGWWPIRTPSDDVRRLVIAARRAFDLGYSDEEFRELDAALEPFSSRVPYDKED